MDHEIQVTVSFIYLKSNVGSYTLIIPNNDVHTSNNLQIIKSMDHEI